ncbi:MAG TPA: cytochrome c biogenesis protein DipZ [Xanthobacteraceae bacterium]|nr:cytochrome c biogenesis protein DipZ [Xanthobacteraceae bacterium]
MTLLILAYLGGVLTIISPCILPVLPFVFARADRPFAKSVLPMLIGMALTFAAVATLAAVAGSWAVDANAYGRAVAMALLAIFGLTLIFPALADRLMAPLVGIGAKLSDSASSAGPNGASILPSFLLGVATGFLWAPCAGPVLGLILTGAALNGANAGTTFLLLAYAAGAMTSLALALAVGGRMFAAMKRSLGAGEWIRRGLGAAVLLAVAVIGLGLDTGFLTRISLSNTLLEQSLVDRLKPPTKSVGASGAAKDSLGTAGGFPSLAGAADWLNSPPLTSRGLRGKVVVIDFWTYSCINCLRSIPYVRAWAEKYKDHGLVVIGVHTPEFAFERNVANVRAAVAALKIDYPVAIDNDYKIWRAFDNEYWPAHYFIDAKGRIRYSHFGEGSYDKSERVIQQLLAEAGNKDVPTGIADVSAWGAEAAPSDSDQSPETYVGYDRADNFVSPGGLAPDESHVYEAAARHKLNQWSLVGDWTDTAEHASLDQPGGRIVYRFHARDLHLVLGPPPDGKPVRFRVTIDGAAPEEDHGADIDAGGAGVVDAQRLYQLVRQIGAVKDRTFAIEFLDPGVQVFAFTFG